MKKLLLLAVCSGLVMTAAAREIYIDFNTGNDRNNGQKTEPLRTFAAAIAQVAPGDTIFLLPAGRPVNTSLIMKNIKGLPDKPIVIDGMFNTICGTVKVEAKDCKEVSPGLYLRKRKDPGKDMILRYFMRFDNKMQRMGRHTKWGKIPLKKVEELQPYEWTVVNGTDCYFRLPPGKTVNDVTVEEPYYNSGVQIYGKSSNVIIRNLTAKSFWNDGFNIHNQCLDVRFENIAAIENSDDGISAHDNSRIYVKNMICIGNSTGFCHINKAECHHENIYITGSDSRDILLNNDVNTLKNIAVDGSSPGGIGFAAGKIQMENCLFNNRRPGTALGVKNTKITASDCRYSQYQVNAKAMPPGLTQAPESEIAAAIKSRYEQLSSQFPLLK